MGIGATEAAPSYETLRRRNLYVVLRGLTVITVAGT